MSQEVERSRGPVFTQFLLGPLFFLPGLPGPGLSTVVLVSVEERAEVEKLLGQPSSAALNLLSGVLHIVPPNSPKPTYPWGHQQGENR